MVLLNDGIRTCSVGDMNLLNVGVSEDTNLLNRPDGCSG